MKPVNTADRNSQEQQETGYNNRLLSASVPPPTGGDRKPEHAVSRNILADGRRRSEDEQDGPLPAACAGDEETGEEQCARRRRHESVEFLSDIDDSDKKKECVIRSNARDVTDDGKWAPAGVAREEAFVMKAGINGIFVIKVWSRIIRLSTLKWHLLCLVMMFLFCFLYTLVSPIPTIYDYLIADEKRSVASLPNYWSLAILALQKHLRPVRTALQRRWRVDAYQTTRLPLNV